VSEGGGVVGINFSMNSSQLLFDPPKNLAAADSRKRNVDLRSGSSNVLHSSVNKRSIMTSHEQEKLQ
jgi:hypothetical protein